jgi:hypothetical protein
MKAMRFFVSLACIFLLSLGITNAQKPVTQGYEIKITGNKISENTLYLQGYYGQDAFIFDSAKVKGQKSVTFKNKKKEMPSGIYTLTDRFGNEYLDLIIDKNSHFSVSGGDWSRDYLSNAIVENSDENAQFIEFQKQMETPGQDFNKIPQMFYESMPESFLGHYLKAKYNINPLLPQLDIDDTTDATMEYQRLINHYFDSYTFEDVRLLHCPIYLDIQNYFIETLPADAKLVTQKAIDFIHSFQDPEAQAYYLPLLFNLFDHTVNSMIYDQAFVALYDQFCKGPNSVNISEDLARYIQRVAERKRKILPGETVPVLVSYDINNGKHASSDIDKDYIIVWFWDADCDECKVETPKLRDFYKEFANYYNLDVYAVAITDDLEKWDKFCKDNDLSSWVNVNYYMNDPNYDFIEYFDLITTPVIYLLDKKHTIIARNFPLEEIHEKLRGKN